MISDISHSYTGDRGRGHHSLSFGLTQPLVVVRHPVRSYVAGNTPARTRRRAAARVHASLGLLPVWLALFALLNTGDLISTYIGLHGGLREGNPLMDGLLLHFGFAALIAYKVMVVAAVSLGVLMLRRFHRGIASATVWICNALVLAVVVLNVLQYAAR